MAGWLLRGLRHGGVLGVKFLSTSLSEVMLCFLVPVMVRVWCPCPQDSCTKDLVTLLKAVNFIIILFLYGKDLPAHC